MIGILRRFSAILSIAVRRLWSSRWLALAAVLGLTAVVAIALSVPLYTDAVYHRTLLTTIDEANVDRQGIRRPPYTFMYRYTGKFDGPLEWGNIINVDRYMTDVVPGSLQLPRLQYVRFFETRLGQLYPVEDAAYHGKREALLWASIATLGEFEKHVDVVSGRLPALSNKIAGGVEVMISKEMADRTGLQTGESYILFYRPEGKDPVQLAITVTGIWTVRDAQEGYWFTHPESLNETLMTVEPVFQQDLGSQITDEVFLATWYMVFDGSSVRSEHVQDLLERIRVTTQRASVLLTRIKIEISPVEALLGYQATSQLLTVQLLAINVPILLLMFAYTLLVANLIVSDRRNEIAVMRSRGATIGQVIVVALFEAVIMGVLAVLAGTPAGRVVAELVGQTRSFLDFTGGSANAAQLAVVITPIALTIAVAVVVFAALMTLLPTASAASHTVITYKQERARSLKPPWWQRTGLDLLLLVPAAYGTYMLQRQGTLVLPSAFSQSVSAVRDPFANPLLFMVPVLSILALTLVLIRVLPHLLRLVAWLLARLPGTALVMASRQLARSPSLYAAPLLLLVLTLGLASFTASLAATLDQHLSNEMRYSTGSDMSMVVLGESTRDTGATVIGGINTGPATGAAGATEQTGPLYMFLPIEEYERAEGVVSSTRVGRYRAEAQFSTRNASARFMGVDRTDYPRTAYWRSDFANQPLGALMNLLSTRADGVLVPDTVLAENALRIDDPIRIVVSLADGNVPVDLTIVGTFHLWPGWNPMQAGVGPLFVGNLDYLFETAGGQVPYEVWLKVHENADPRAIITALQKMGVVVTNYAHVQTRVDREQTRPERQGLFGMLSVGFGAAGLFTVLGFFLYTVFSLRRRIIELGVLRAIGFSSTQMAVYLGSELALLLGVGIGAGTLLGVVASRLYIPFFQISATDEGLALPYAVVVAWSDIFLIYAVFAALFVVALIALILILRRMRVFEAVKLGESV